VLRVQILALALPLALAGSLARAGDVITFETNPAGGTPIDNAPLSDPYAITGGTVRFFFDVNGNNAFDAGTDALPVFEATGDADGDPSGFRSTRNQGFDRPSAPGLGNWFLRPTAELVNLPAPVNFLIDYDTTRTIDALSGEIWDIDAGGNGYEQWRVDVLDRDNNVVARQFSPVGIDQAAPNSLDSLPWTFSFSNLTSLSLTIDKVRLVYIGTRTPGYGLAFNNFSAFGPQAVPPVPEPGTLLLSGIGLAALALARRSRRVRRDA
jgi:hypothetical protein